MRAHPMAGDTVFAVLLGLFDLLLFTAGATVANVIGLMLMHLTVATVVVLALRPTLPDSAPAPAAGDVQHVRG